MMRSYRATKFGALFVQTLRADQHATRLRFLFAQQSILFSSIGDKSAASAYNHQAANSTTTTTADNGSAVVEEESFVEVTCDEELQPQWKALENRVNMRKSKTVVPGLPTGRGPRRKGAWDHENV